MYDMKESEYINLLQNLVETETVSPLNETSISKISCILANYQLKRGHGQYWINETSKFDTWIYTHIDTKPPLPKSDWVTDPYKLIKKNNRLYGLGVSDSKFQLLNALIIFPSELYCHIVDGAEEIGGIDAAQVIQKNKIKNLVIVDGFSTARTTAIYNGLVGQLDGNIQFSTGDLPTHPSREQRIKLIAWFKSMLEYINQAKFQFNITGIFTEITERSLTSESIEIRFDIRYRREDYSSIEEFILSYDPIIRQHYKPLIGLKGRKETQIASFSNILGSICTNVEYIYILPGAKPENNNHRPNEWIDIKQIAKHQNLLKSWKESIQN